MQETKLFIKLLEDEMINFNAILIKNYKRLNITEQEIIVLSMLSRQEMKGSKSFNASLFASKTGLSESDFYDCLNSLENKGYLEIKTETALGNKRAGEYFYLDNVYNQIVRIYLEQIRKESESNASTFEERVSDLVEDVFMAQLTPIDIEIIQKWASDGDFSYDQIRKALLDAQSKGKTTLKYVDSQLIKTKMKSENKEEKENTQQVIAELKQRWNK